MRPSMTSVFYPSPPQHHSLQTQSTTSLAWVFPPNFTPYEKKLNLDVKHYLWDDPYLFKVCGDNMVRRCVPIEEAHSILTHCHSMEARGHFGPTRTAYKVLQSGFYWPTIFKYANHFVRSCDNCQRSGNISKCQEMPQNNLLMCELFDVWGINFLGLFLKSFVNEYIDYISKWVEAISLTTNDAQSVVKFLKKNIFTRFVISDGGTHFCNRKLKKLYHPQTNRQVEISNRKLKMILEKTMNA
ncbi:putative mitochondrial protein, partial [Mucuna pruriens]